jgi:multidrug resistance protein, MATE family
MLKNYVFSIILSSGLLIYPFYKSISGKVIMFDANTGKSAVDTSLLLKKKSARSPDWRQFMQDYCSVASKAFPMAASYTFSIEQVVTGIIALGLNSDAEHAAATVLLQTVMSTSIRLSLAPLFAVSTYGCSLFGELTRLEQSEEFNLSLVQQKRSEIDSMLRAGYVLSVAVTVPALSALLFSKQMLTALGQSDQVSELASGFLKPYALSAPALAIRMTLGQIMFAKGDAKPAMYIGMCTLAIGSTMAYWFANGGIGLKPLLLPGLAWGLNIESWLTAIGYAGYMSRDEKYAAFNFFNCADLDFHQIKQKFNLLMTVGGPIALTMLVESSMIFVMGLVAGLIDIEKQAELAYSIQIVFLMFIVLMAFGQATGHSVGRRKGEGKYDDASRLAKNGLIATVVTVLPFAAPVIFAPQLLYNVLNIKSAHDKIMVGKLVPLIMLGGMLQSARYNVNQVLRALGDNKGSTVNSVAGMSCGLLVSVIVGLNTEAGIFGIASGLALGEGCSLIGLLRRWHKRTQSGAIARVSNGSAVAEPETWGLYFKSFFSPKRQSASLLADDGLRAGDAVNYDSV